MKNIGSIVLLFLLFAGLFYSCKESPNNPALKESKVEFVFSSSLVKSASEQGLTSIVVTIEDLQGNSILSSEKIDIYHMNGRYISEPVALISGDYKLTRFLVLNGENDVVYVTPKEGSDKAHLVKNPLPINFSSNEDSITNITPEVVGVADSNPEEFGYVSFSFDIANRFKILMGAAVIDPSSQNYELTDAQVKIFNDTTIVYEGILDPFTSGVDSVNYDSLNLVNEITLPEEYDNFTVIISKQGYKDYNKTFPKEELRLYYREEDKGPLVVVLEEGCNLPVGTANFEVYPRFQFWPDNSVSIENLSIQDASNYIFDFGDTTQSIQAGFTSTISHKYEFPGIYPLKLAVYTSEGCVSVHSDTIVILHAFAGLDQILTLDTASMTANDPYPGNGTWSIISGHATIVNPDDPKTPITGLSLGTNVFRWTVEYNGEMQYDDVTIEYDGALTTNAGLDRILCSGSTYLNALAPAQGTGTWSIVAGNGNFIDINAPNTEVTGLNLGANIFKWTVELNGSTAYDEVVITNNQINAYAGADQTISSDATCLNASNPFSGAGNWTIISGTANVITDATNPNTCITGLASGANTFRWTVYNGGCTDYDEVTIFSNQ